MSDLLNQQLGNYRLLRLIGSGSFADVYLGEHIHLGTKAALKVLHAPLLSEEEEHFYQEGRTIARLIHPHIIRVFDFGIERAAPFLVMDYAPHGSLRQRYPKGARLSALEVLPFVKQVTSALQYAHDQQVIHRDVKPENMLLNSHDEVVLSDFGIAVIVQSTRGSTTQDVVGTAAYMAPEQIQGHPQPASDQYALGIVLYEWLSGDWPFHGSFTEVCSQHLFTPPPPLHEKLSGIAPAIEAVISRALAKEPEQRFASIEEMAAAFEEACQNETKRLAPDEAPTMRRTPSSACGRSPGDSSLEKTGVAPAGSLPPTRRADSASRGAPPDVPSLPPAVPPEKRGIPRRVVIGAGAALAGLAGVGALTWYVLTLPGKKVSSERFTAPPSPTPSSRPAAPQGATLFTYHGHTEAVYAVAWSPNGLYVVSGSGDTTARVWNASNGDTLYTYRGHSGLLNSVFSVSWASSGSMIVSGSADKTAQVWEAATGNRITLYQGHTARVLSVAWSPEATHVASGSADNSVQVWEATTGKLVAFYAGHSATVYAVAWSPDGTLIASAGVDKTVQVWEVVSQKMVAAYKGHTDAVYALAWSPDGKLLASGGADKTVQIWEARTAAHSLTYQSSKDLATAVSALSWSPDGKRIASASTDKTVQVWEAATGKHIYTYQEHSDPVYTVAWNPDGQAIASGSADRTVKIWRSI